MSDKFQAAVQAICQRFGAQASEFRGDTTLLLSGETLIAAAQALKQEFEFNMLMDITAVDYWPQQQPRFHAVYQLYSMALNMLLCLRVPVPAGEAPALPTLEGVYKNANWKEREIWDLFGICFEGHSDLRRIVLSADWQGHPLRKDYPLGYEEVQFSFNFEEIERSKPHSRNIR